MKTLTALSLLCVAALCAQGDGQSDQRVVKQDDQAVQTTSRLIKLSDTEAAQWLSEFQVMGLVKQGTRFMDITDHQEEENNDVVRPARDDKVPTSVSNQDEVSLFLKDLTTDFMQQWLAKFTSFHTRYYKSTWGAQSCAWLISKVREIAEPAGNRITVREFKHSWQQFSIIARFEGTNKDLDNEAVIISAHQDSVNMWLPSLGRSPGADDDGSGTVTILEVFRTLVKNGFQPERPVEFHWYSAEEGGLLGSQEVAKQYNKEGREIVAMIQNDMTGYIGAHGEVIGLVTDYVNDKLTNFIRDLIKSYAEIPVVDTKCGYACSDHASWRKFGYPSAFMIESSFEDSNQRIHTSDDSIKYLSFDHMLQFSRVLVGFAVELSHAD
ncbi:hypothetical protein BDB00DRAFT_929696 [Zychaea mexicana]|uniref:uncharacterized protein n=1 Tax=Zychaea mexicana TaxID=64656 RepID=UPI0022FE95E9|nr:uncharacterized protein BDB00DRAFT_929696 [Zychaea mexicana]KAI9492470.1 hypothetical protein BDB00DRAFT_929696 [Zychaea mexicana]